MLYLCYLFSVANIKLFFQSCNIFFMILLNNVATVVYLRQSSEKIKKYVVITCALVINVDKYPPVVELQFDVVRQLYLEAIALPFDLGNNTSREMTIYISTD